MDAKKEAKTLGVNFDLRNDFKSQYECVWDKITDINIKLKSIKLSQKNVIKQCNHFIVPR